MEVYPGIYRIIIMSPTVAYAHLNIYIIDGTNGCLMIDTGWNMKEALDSLEKQLKEIGRNFNDIEQIIVTHTHPDHFGLAGKVKELSGAKLALHEEEVNVLGSRFISVQQLWHDIAKWMRMNGFPDEELLESQKATPWMTHYSAPGLPDRLLHNDDIVSTGIFDFRVIWTPGHSPGHICLYEDKNKVLLSGDHILPTISPNVGRGPWTGDNPLGDYLTSLDNIKKLDTKLILPAHENPFYDLQKRIDELTHHHDGRKLSMQKVFYSEVKTAYDVASEVMWTANGQDTRFENLKYMDRRMALWETLSHLELLCVEGELEKFNNNDIIFYRVPNSN